LDDHVEAVSLGELALKGFHNPVPAFELVAWRGMLDATIPTRAAAETHSPSVLP
jgi:class 3 adenylate cyclase